MTTIKKLMLPQFLEDEPDTCILTSPYYGYGAAGKNTGSVPNAGSVDRIRRIVKFDIRRQKRTPTVTQLMALFLVCKKVSAC